LYQCTGHATPQDLCQPANNNCNIQISISHRDFNNDTLDTAFFARRFQTLGLVDALAIFHGTPTLVMHKWGTKPIDEMLLSPALLHGATSGYLAFKEGLMSDHKGLWLNLNLKVVMGLMARLSNTGAAHRLKYSCDSRIVTKYNQYLLATIQQQT